MCTASRVDLQAELEPTMLSLQSVFSIEGTGEAAAAYKCVFEMIIKAAAKFIDAAVGSQPAQLMSQLAGADDWPELDAIELVLEKLGRELKSGPNVEAAAYAITSFNREAGKARRHHAVGLARKAEGSRASSERVRPPLFDMLEALTTPPSTSALQSSKQKAG